jgi:Fur family ferric uptake transcriptional regulator
MTEKSSIIEQMCKEKGIRLTEHRRLIAKVISESNNHPDVEEVYRQASSLNNAIGIATVYRTIKLFEELGVITKHDFQSKGKARYEVQQELEHHDHLVNIINGEVIEFFNQELEDLKEKIAKNYGFELIGHRLELYCKPIEE